jgi:hypothetical protein
MVVPDIETRRVPLSIRTAQAQILLILGVRSHFLGRIVPQALAVAEFAFILIPSALLLSLASGLRVASAATALRRRR